MTIRLWGDRSIVNTTTANGQNDSVVTALLDGGYIIAWTDDRGPATSVVKFQRFDASGAKVGPEITVPSFDGSGDQSKPSIALLSDGNFVIVNQDNDGATNQITYTRYSSSGAFLSQAQLSNNGIEPAVRANPFDPGSFVISYANTTANRTSVATISNTGVIQNDSLNFESPVGGLQSEGWSSSNYISALSNGDIDIRQGSYFSPVLAVTGIARDPHMLMADFGLYYCFTEYDGSGNGIPHVFRSALSGLTPPSEFDRVYTARLITGQQFARDFNLYQATSDSLIAVWTEDVPSQIGTVSIHCRLVGSDLVPIGPEWTVSSVGSEVHGLPTVTQLADGRLVVTWTDASGLADGSNAGILQQFIDPRDGAVTGRDDPSVAETLFGNDVHNDQMQGLAGDDTMYGLAGHDVMFGGDGLDSMYGGRGDDTMYGGNARDTMFGELGNDDMYGDAGLDLMRGGNGDDRLFGGADNDSMYGEGDNDTLIGGAGMDYLEGGSGFDLASYETSTLGVRVDMVFRSGNTNDAVGDTFVNIEGLTGSNFGDFLTSTYGDDTVNGLGGADYIDARSGNDTLYGGAGADQIYAGDGNDILEGGLDNDYLDGGNNIDTASYANAGAGVTVDMLNGAINTGEAAGDVLYQIENLTGSILNDNLYGDNLNNTISGGDGDDSLLGRGGNDTLLGGQGVDVLTGGDGNDILTGGLDGDIFRYDTTTFNADTITDFQDNLDKFLMAGSGLTFASFTITQVGADTVMTVTGSPSNTITLANFIASNITAADFI
jgi:Ca2+-binding RTX toxin-like protein